MGRAIYDDVKSLLIDRGWKIDEQVKPNRLGELLEFIHPDDGVRVAWLDALLDEEEREVEASRKELLSRLSLFNSARPVMGCELHLAVPNMKFNGEYLEARLKQLCESRGFRVNKIWSL